jgi:hypothetical protein
MTGKLSKKYSVQGLSIRLAILQNTIVCVNQFRIGEVNADWSAAFIVFFSFQSFLVLIMVAFAFVIIILLQFKPKPVIFTEGRLSTLF